MSNFADDWPPLMQAAQRGRKDIVEDLLKQGADVNEADSFGLSALSLAASECHTEIVRLLLDNGADANACFLIYRVQARDC